MKKVLMILLIGPFVLQANAEQVSYQDFHYKVKEEAFDSVWHSSLQNPTEILYEHLRDQLEAAEQVFDLWNFVRLSGRPDQGAPPYNRSGQFGSWRNERNSCLNTRAMVLIRDTQVPVKMRSSGCTVDTGFWSDPYGGRDYRMASDIQIDHFVPLKNAYINGAHLWSNRKRCVYTNFKGDREHLLPVYSKENSRKSDRAPDQYMPPQRGYHCRYLANWLRIKFTWGLALRESERVFIEDTLRVENCSMAEFRVTASQVQQLRRNIADSEKNCP